MGRSYIIHTLSKSINVYQTATHLSVSLVKQLIIHYCHWIQFSSYLLSQWKHDIHHFQYFTDVIKPKSFAEPRLPVRLNTKAHINRKRKKMVSSFAVWASVVSYLITREPQALLKFCLQGPHNYFVWPATGRCSA